MIPGMPDLGLVQWQGTDYPKEVDTPERASYALELLGEAERAARQIDTAVRMALGELLKQIHRNEVYRKMGFKTWTLFLDEGAPRISGLAKRTIYEAFELTGSKLLSGMTLEQRAEIPVSNAKTLARLERVNPEKAKNPETIEKAKRMSSREFKREVGSSDGYRVSAWLDTKEAGKAVQRILDQLRFVSPDAANTFADFLDGAEVSSRAGDGIDNKIDLILATMRLEFQREEQENQELAEYCPRGHAIEPPGLGWCQTCRDGGVELVDPEEVYDE